MTIGTTFLLISCLSIFKGKPFICSLLRLYNFYDDVTKSTTSCHSGKFRAAPRKKSACTPMVISPLRRITADQIAELLLVGLSAVELSDQYISEVVRSPSQYIYASGASLINKVFQDKLYIYAINYFF